MTLAHAMRASIEAEMPGAEVLIHVEPETSLREPATASPTGLGSHCEHH